MLRERLRSGLAKTREVLGLAISSAAPDWDALEESLVLADVGLATSQQVLEGVRARGGDYRAALREELLAALRERRRERAGPSAGEPFVTVVVGVNGVGKTTTVAKLAHRAAASGTADDVLLVAADTFRAAAQEQLAAWASRIGAPIVVGAPGRDPASVVHEGLQAGVARGVRRIVVDTAGRLHTKRPLMDELGKIERVASRVVANAPHETLLVMDATVGTNGLTQAREFLAALDVTGVVLTKMDGTAKGGVVLAIARELSLPVRFTGVGEGLEDLVPFEAEVFVDALLSTEG